MLMVAVAQVLTGRPSWHFDAETASLLAEHLSLLPVMVCLRPVPPKDQVTLVVELSRLQIVTHPKIRGERQVR